MQRRAAVAAAGEDLAHLNLRGPHDLRHTFATWLEDAGIPSRVIDELMGHAGGRRAGGSPAGLPGDDPGDARSRRGRAGRPARAALQRFSKPLKKMRQDRS
jgi:hypothetical protein